MRLWLLTAGLLGLPVGVAQARAPLATGNGVVGEHTASFRGNAPRPYVSTSRATAGVRLSFSRWAAAAPSPWPTMPTLPSATATAAWHCAASEPALEPDD